MSKNRRGNSLLSTQAKFSYSNSNQDELLSMKYHMVYPKDDIYPLNPDGELHKEDINGSKEVQTYPDFQPWKDHTKLPRDEAEAEAAKMDNSVYLNKGLFDMPQVSNEYYSGCNLIQATIFSSSENCAKVLKELSQHLTNAYKSRNEVINKIRYDSNRFKLPPRVTLTSAKREAWLKDLADPNVPLSKISARLPHGVKNKALVDALCSKDVPIVRALWFTRAVLYGDALAIRKKIQSKLGHNTSAGNELAKIEAYEIQWLQEWTQQLVDYIYKFAKEMSNITVSGKKHDYLKKLNYLLKYTQALYLECLIDKNMLVASVLKFLRDGLPLDTNSIISILLSSKEDNSEGLNSTIRRDIDLNYGPKFVALTLIKIFWLDIVKMDFLSKDLGEGLLLNYYFIATPSGPFSPISTAIKEALLDQISESIKYLFRYNTNVFIIPTYWVLIGEALYKILLEDTSKLKELEVEEIQRQLQLIQYRNESLMLNTKNTAKDHSVMTHDRKPSIAYNSLNPFDKFSPGIPAPVITDENYEGELFINRSSDDVLRIIDYLDKLKLNEDLAALLRPPLPKTKSKANTDWRSNLTVLVFWCLTQYRNKPVSSENILILCGFLKRMVLSPANSKALVKFKASFENALLDILFSSPFVTETSLNLGNLFVLVNELYQLKIITVSAYLRKLIASGLFYVSSDSELKQRREDPAVVIHLKILKNLPVLNNKQCDNILQKWTGIEHDFKGIFEAAQQKLRTLIVDKVSGFDSQETDFEFIKALEIGTRFLLVNWVTGELKATINNSSKLIHIRANMIAVLYYYYAESNNLTVFFKDIVKFVLKNEGKVIILEMDALHLISRLTIRHFKLVKSFTYNESASIGYDIFRLIVQNYNDNSELDTEYLNFIDIWRFIDKRIDRNTTEVVNRPDIPKSAIPQFIYSKATVESPMRLISQDSNGLRANDKTTIDAFGNDLNILLNTNYQCMSPDDIDSSLNSLGIGSLGITNTRKLLWGLLEFGTKRLSSISGPDRVRLTRLLIDTKHKLQLEDTFAIFESLNGFVKYQLGLENYKEIEKGLETFLKFLIYKEVFDLAHIISMLNSIGIEHDVDILVVAIVFPHQEEKTEMMIDDFLLLELFRDQFYEQNVNTCFDIVCKHLKKEGSDILHSFFMKQYETQILFFFKNWVVNHPRLFIDNVIKSFTQDQVLEILNFILGWDHHVKSMDDIKLMMQGLDEFSLPVCQILIRIVVTRDCTGLSDGEINTKLGSFSHDILSNVRFKFTPDNSYFGELFNLLETGSKIKLLSIFEEIFLHQTTFCTQVASPGEEKVNCTIEGGMLDFLPVLLDFFKKVSVSSVDNLGTSKRLLQALNEFLSRLVELANSETDLGENQNTFRVISIFIRILIVHKNSLTQSMLKEDIIEFKFAHNLMRLLDSRYLAQGNEKLRILLYDLLLLLKSCLEQTFPAQETTIPLANSPPGQPQQFGAEETFKIPGDTPVTESDNFSGTPAVHINERPTNASAQLASIFNLPEINSSNPLKEYLDDSKICGAIMLQRHELNNAGDIHNANNSNLLLVNTRDSTVLGPFNLLGEKEQLMVSDFKIRSYELIDNPDSGINDGRINLALFDAYMTKQNPP